MLSRHPDVAPLLVEVCLASKDTGGKLVILNRAQLFPHRAHSSRPRGLDKVPHLFSSSSFYSSCSLSCLLLSIPCSPSTSYSYAELHRAFASSPRAHLSSQHFPFSSTPPVPPFIFTPLLLAPFSHSVITSSPLASCLGTSRLRHTWQHLPSLEFSCQCAMDEDSHPSVECISPQRGV